MKTASSTTGLVELEPQHQLAKQTLDDLERLGHGLSLLARAAGRVGEKQLETFAMEAEDALWQRSEQLRALLPHASWTGP